MENLELYFFEVVDNVREFYELEYLLKWKAYNKILYFYYY